MISERESFAIKYIRVGAMLAIVSCHMFQACANQWAYVLNIGVQVFLALSGYLYGKKIVTNWGQWAVGRIKRVYLPMFLFLIAVLPFYLIFHREIFSWKAYTMNYANLQGIMFATGGEMLSGIRHLWFITAIMFAYLTTPVLQRLSKFAKWLFPMVLGCVGILYIVAPMPLVFLASWFFLYAICYLYVHLNQTKWYDMGLLVLELLLILLVCIHTDVLNIYFNPLNRLFHDVSGIFVVLFGIRLLSKINIKGVPKIVDWLDRYSFQIFIVHYFFLIGPFSMVHLTDSVFLNLTISCVTILITTIVFSKINNIVNVLLFPKKNENKFDRTVRGVS
jgi:peptidoglycan/LPS O-acetylase OafA/YrhL